MAKFKVGYRVKVINRCNGEYRTANGVIVEIDNDDYLIQADDSVYWMWKSRERGAYCWWAGKEDIEPGPEAKARYIVSADLPTHITVWHDTMDEALTEARRLCVKQGKAFHVLKVVAEVNPGRPEVIRMDKE